VSAYVLDTGVLIALQRDQRRLRALAKLAREEALALRCSAPVLVEFLGGARPGARAAAAYVSSHVTFGPVDGAVARRAASLRQVALDAGKRSRPSAIDALVAVEAERTGGLLLFDGDHADFAALASASGSIEIVDLADLV
jgi:predicted nucleic acid-binding protein